MKTTDVIGLFHTLWTKAVGTPNYDKAEWMELERKLIRFELLETLHREKEEDLKIMLDKG